MTPGVADVVGAVVATVVWDSLLTQGFGPRPALRVTGFANDEVIAAVGALERIGRERGSSGLVIKVGTKARSGGTSGVPPAGGPDAHPLA